MLGEVITTTGRLHVAELDRRGVLQGAALVAGAGLIAACGGGSDDGSPSSAPSVPSSAPEPTASPTPAVLAALSDITVGTAVSAKTPDGEKIILARPSTTRVVGFSAKCPHRGCTVEPKPDKLACPCHGSTYATTTGERLGGPAPTGLTPFPVRVVGGNVVTA
jgi:cytochrome b6-f complex iron-sulfur subunit